MDKLVCLSLLDCSIGFGGFRFPPAGAENHGNAGGGQIFDSYWSSGSECAGKQRNESGDRRVGENLRHFRQGTYSFPSLISGLVQGQPWDAKGFKSFLKTDIQRHR